MEVPASGGLIVGNTRKEIEANIGTSIVTPLNAKNMGALPEPDSPAGDES